MDIFDLASDNAPSLAERFEDVKAKASADEADTLDRFAERVMQDGRVSMNMRPWTLSSLLSTGKHQNMYQWAEEQAGFSGRPLDEILREKLGPYYERRIAFDSAFDDGRLFRYGALNIGGAGATKYGKFCAVLASDFAAGGEDVAYLKFDSLNTYVRAKAEVDEAAISGDVASHASRDKLTALKHVHEIPTVDEHDWPGLVCSDSDYVEAIFLEEVTPQDAEEVRVPEQDYRRLRRLAFDDFAQKRRDGTRALVQDFNDILRADRDGVIRLKRI